MRSVYAVFIIIGFVLVFSAGAGGSEIVKLWSYPLKTSITADDFVCISGDGKYIAAVSEYTNLYMFDADGTLRWNYNIKTSGYEDLSNINGLSAPDDFSRVYVTAEASSNVFVFDDAGDLVREEFPEDQPTSCCASGDGSKVFIGYADGRLDCYGTEGRLKLLWTFSQPAVVPPGETPPWRATAVEMLAASDDGGTVVALVGKRQVTVFGPSGTVRYRYPAAADVTSLAVNGAGSVIAVGYEAPEPGAGELVILPPKPASKKAVRPLRRYRFESYVNSVDMSDGGELTFVGLDAMLDISFKLMDEKGTAIISQDLGAAVDKLAVSDDGRFFAVLDDIGGENLSYYEYVPEGAVATSPGAPGEPGIRAWSVVGDMYLILAILLAVVTGILVLRSLAAVNRRVLRNIWLCAVVAFILGVGSILLGLRVNEGNIIGGGGVLFFAGVGLVLFLILFRSRAKTDTLMTRFLGIIESRGQVKLSWLAKELGLKEKALENLIYDAVATGRFKGYINWKSGDLYAKSAAELETNRCPVCGATLEFAGKGVVKCEYCGTETFL